MTLLLRSLNAIWWLPTLFLSASPVVVQAEDYLYTTNNGTITITKYTGSNVVVDIPGTINDMNVTTIGSNAFSRYNSLISVTIPDSVTAIGYGAFQFCFKLVSVNIGDNVADIGDYAFCGVNLTNVTIPSSVTNIGDHGFYGGTMTSVTIPDSVLIIGNCAFQSSTNLTTLTMGKNVTSIGDFAFHACHKLATAVMISPTVTNIGTSAFDRCIRLPAIAVDESNTVYSSVDGVLFDKAQTTLIQCPGGKTGTCTIPPSVTTIASNEFYYSSSLTSITVDPANAVYSSVAGVLFDESQTTLIKCPQGKTGACTMPASVTNIGVDAFYRCTRLPSITVDPGNSVYSSADGVLFNKSQTKLIICPGGKTGTCTMPVTVTLIGDNAFHDCTSLTGVTMGNNVTSIGDQAFFFCTSLTNICIPDSVTNIGNGAFYWCTNLNSVAIGSRVTSIGGQAFEYCFSLTSICIPDSVTSIGYYAFALCTNLNSATIGSSVMSIADGAFQSCSRLNNVTLPNGVMSIGNGAFYSCSGLTSVTVGSSLTNVGGQAFRFCSNLTSVYFTGNAPTAGSTVFYGTNAPIHVTIYHLPGTSNWGSTFAGRPVVLWNPQARSDATFGVGPRGFGFTITGPTNVPIVVQACTNLVESAWLALATNTLTGGTSYFSDPQWTNDPARFYRFCAP